MDDRMSHLKHVSVKFNNLTDSIIIKDIVTRKHLVEFKLDELQKHVRDRWMSLLDAYRNGYIDTYCLLNVNIQTNDWFTWHDCIVNLHLNGPKNAVKWIVDSYYGP
jgi:hypothetical protein